jgi:serine/threonine-protein kinase RsbW
VTEETAARQTAVNGGVPGPSTVAPDRETGDHVRVSMPAEGAYLSVLRTATAGLAARLDFTLDEIEDFELGAELMTVTVSVASTEPRAPAKDTFSWTVLSALAGTVDSRLGPGDHVAIVLRKRRGTARPG